MNMSGKAMSVLLTLVFLLSVISVGLIGVAASAETPKPIVNLGEEGFVGVPEKEVSQEVKDLFEAKVPGTNVVGSRLEWNCRDSDWFEWWMASAVMNEGETSYPLNIDASTSQGMSFYVWFAPDSQTTNLQISIWVVDPTNPSNKMIYGKNVELDCEKGVLVPVWLKWEDIQLQDSNGMFTGSVPDMDLVEIANQVCVNHYILRNNPENTVALDFAISDIYEYGELPGAGLPPVTEPPSDPAGDGASTGKIIDLATGKFRGQPDGSLTEQMHDAFEAVIPSEGNNIVAGVASIPAGFSGTANPMIQNAWSADQAPFKATVKRSSAGVSFYIWFPADSVSSDFRVVVLSGGKEFGKNYTNLQRGKLNEISLLWTDLKMKQKVAANTYDYVGRDMDMETLKVATKFQIVQELKIENMATDSISGLAICDFYEYGYLPGCSAQPISTTEPPTTEPPTTVANPKLGDVNADGKIGAPDALMALKHSVQSITLTDAAFVCANVNGDTAVNSNDALLIMKYSVHLITKFPAAAAE